MPSLDRALSSMSISSTPSRQDSEDDWDRSLPLPDLASTDPPTTPPPDAPLHPNSPSASRNSVAFPSDHTPRRATRYSTSSAAGAADLAPEEAAAAATRQAQGSGQAKRTISDLLRLHSETGCPGTFSPDEASRIADVLGQWINASSSPYEPDTDDFFSPQSQSQDDIALTQSHSTPSSSDMLAPPGRPRGRSESATPSRPGSALGVVGA